MSQRVLTGIQRGKAGYLFLILFLFLHRQELPRPCSLPFLETERFLSTWRAILLLHEGVLSSHLRAMWYVEMLCFDVMLEDFYLACSRRSVRRGSELIGAKVRVVLRNPTQTSSLFPLLRVPLHHLLSHFVLLT